MWKNMTWLAAEWRYYFEWRKLALAQRLEGKDAPPKAIPWGYTFRWMGVAIVFPLTIATAIGSIWWAVLNSQAAATFFTGLGILLIIVAVVIWIIWSFVEMTDKGPSAGVEKHWTRLNGPQDH